MAVGPRQTDSNNRYDPNQDFTSDQLRRFGHVANQAQRNREQREREEKLFGVVKTAKKRALKPVVTPKNAKEAKSLRYAVWLFVALIAALWIMYMTA
ncbi:hypothetical protein [Vibrio rhodolitus]|uniref:hypothetical protein n=1 Tax=Vibrio rhodolitus TaxID=2231649 RepID=UPI000E0B06AE|nr:hypothetical protein [Vibrio rhodolitus]